MNANRKKIRVEKPEKCSTRESPPEQLKSNLVVGNRTWTQSLGLMTWEVMRRNALNRSANWRLTQLSNCINSPHRVSSNKRVANSGRTVKSQLSNIHSITVLGTIGRLYILWWVNKPSRAITKWTRSCDNLRGSFDSVLSECW